MKKIYYLSTCDTSRRIIRQLDGLEGFVRQDIKTEPITAAQIREMKEMAGTYEALFSRRAIRYKEMNLKDQVLKESDYKELILAEYTFLKRPVIIDGGEIFVGSERKTVELAEKVILKKG
jgi:arsenate reductase (glutaredoxin)